MLDFKNSQLSTRNGARGVHLMRIDSFSFGSINIEGENYVKDVLLLPPRIISPWWREAGHRLGLRDLSEVLKYRPDSLVVGTGVSGMMNVPDSAIKELESAGIRVETFTTDKACERFNKLMERGKKVAGAMHLTC
jgi:hypothetical protein